MKKYFSRQIGFIAGICSILLLAGCSNHFSPTPVLQEIPGQGMVTIHIGDGDTSRTLFPQTPEFSLYKLEFTPLNGQDAKGPEEVTGTSPTFALAVGNWTISVTAYIDINGLEDSGISDALYEAAWGSANLNVSNTQPNSVVVDIRGSVDNGGGIFKYEISLPDEMDTAILKILNLDGTVGTEIDILEKDNSGFLILNSGYYILYLELEYQEVRLVKVEVIHIYQLMTTSAEGAGYTFTPGDFLILRPVPSAPDVQILNTDVSEITVIWDAVEYADSYDVQYREDNEAFKQYRNITTSTATITGLKSNTRYYVRVRARSTSGLGEWSAALETATNSAIPETPDIPTVTAGRGEISVSWRAAGSAVSYEVWYRRANEDGEGQQFMPDEIITETSIVIGSLENNVAYQVRIRTVNPSGSSDFSPWSEARTPVANLPLTPAMPEIPNISSNGFTVTWASLAGAINYQVWLATENNINAAEIRGTVNTNAPLTMNVTGLNAGTVYYIWVRALNLNGQSGAYSPAAKCVTVLPPPVVTSITPAKERLTVNWSASASASVYDIYLSMFEDDTPSAFTIPTATVTNNTLVTVGELTPNKTYYVWVRAKRDNNGEWVFSEWSEQSLGRVLDNSTAISNFRLSYGEANEYLGTIEGNLIRVTVPYERNLSSVQAYFDLPSGAGANLSSGSSANFTAPRDIIVTAEDGETRAEYTVIVTVNTPIQIYFAGPDDETIDIASMPETISISDALNLVVPTGYAGYKWLVNNASAGSDNNYLLDASTLTLGPHSVTLVIYKEDGDIPVPYSKTYSFTVTP